MIMLISSKDKAKLIRIVRLAEKITDKNLISLTELYTQSTKRKVHIIVACDTHPLFNKFSLLASGRRYRVPLAKKKKKKKK